MYLCDFSPPMLIYSTQRLFDGQISKVDYILEQFKELQSFVELHNHVSLNKKGLNKGSVYTKKIVLLLFYMKLPHFP